jgi:hypothetical protein
MTKTAMTKTPETRAQGAAHGVLNIGICRFGHCLGFDAWSLVLLPVLER